MHSIRNSAAVENVGPCQKPSHSGEKLNARKADGLHDIKHLGNGFNSVALFGEIAADSSCRRIYAVSNVKWDNACRTLCAGRLTYGSCSK